MNGLYNLGNTCFLNSCLQVLFQIPQLHEIAHRLESVSRQVPPTTEKKYKSRQILHEWKLLAAQTRQRNNNKPINPQLFVQLFFRLTKLQPGAQHDVVEFLILLIDIFHEALSRQVTMEVKGKPVTEVDCMAVKCFERIQEMYANDYSEIWSLFFGTQVSIIARTNANTKENTSTKEKEKEKEVVSTTPEPIFVIHLPIPLQFQQQHQSTIIELTDCIETYLAEEVIEHFKPDTSGSDKDNGNDNVFTKRIEFFQLPNILVIDLKRFNNRNNKLHNFVRFPLQNLDMSPYVKGYDTSCQYDLIGVCNHSGNSLGGHYTSYVKHHKTQQWMLANDSSVSPVDPALAERFIVSPNAYCLFYQRK